MNIKPILESVASGLKKNGQVVFKNVYYGTDYETNIKAATYIDYPLCQVFPPLSSGIDISPTGLMRDRWQVFVFFCDIQPGGSDASSYEIETITTGMREQAVSFVGTLSNRLEFTPIVSADFKHLSFKFDALVSGILVSFTLNEKVGYRICIEE